jgi:hypothetical protein
MSHESERETFRYVTLSALRQQPHVMRELEREREREREIERERERERASERERERERERKKEREREREKIVQCQHVQAPNLLSVS